MSRRVRHLVLFAVGFGLHASNAASPSTEPAFTFRNVGYFHRWSQNNQHEFTPENQDDLKKWSDMITVNGYPDIDDGDGLAAAANAVLENYKKHEAKVRKTNSVPRTADRPRSISSPSCLSGRILSRWPLLGSSW